MERKGAAPDESPVFFNAIMPFLCRILSRLVGSSEGCPRAVCATVELVCSCVLVSQVARHLCAATRQGCGIGNAGLGSSVWEVWESKAVHGFSFLLVSSFVSKVHRRASSCQLGSLVYTPALASSSSVISDRLANSAKVLVEKMPSPSHSPPACGLGMPNRTGSLDADRAG